MVARAMTSCRTRICRVYAKLVTVHGSSSHGLDLLKDVQMYGRKRGRSTSRAEPDLVATATTLPWRLAAHGGMT